MWHDQLYSVHKRSNIVHQSNAIPTDPQIIAPGNEKTVNKEDTCPNILDNLFSIL